MDCLRINQQLPNSSVSQYYDGILLKTGDSLEQIRRLSAPLDLDSSFVKDDQTNEFVERK
jgi:hypothetical protein